MRVIFFVPLASLPLGMASTQRLTSLARGVKEAGAFAKILLPCATERSASTSNNMTEGEVFGVPFLYTPGTPFLAASRLGRVLQDIKGLWVALREIARERRLASEQNDQMIVICYTRFILMVMIVSVWCHWLGVKLIAEMCEWPITQSTPMKLARLRKRLYCRWVVRFVDGAFPISRYIEQRLLEKAVLCGKKLDMLTVPILVDTCETMQAQMPPPFTGPYILFSGSPGYLKTIEFLLDMFIPLASCDIRLHLVMTGMDPVKHGWLKRAVEKRGLAGRVLFPGFIPRQDLLAAYRHASALLIPLFSDAQSKARFPTKLAEYLMSGRPVVTNRVGEIERYLCDGKSAFLVDPDRPDLFAESVKYVLSHTEEADRVGQEGCVIAKESFDYRIHGKRMLVWLQGVAGGSSGVSV